MQIADILKEKGGRVISIDMGASINEAVDTLNKHNIGSLVVLDDKSEISGIITERDILRNFERCLKSGLKVEDIMTRNVIICITSDDVETVMKVMTHNRIRHLPIMKDRKLAGIVSIGDVLKSLHDQQATEIRYLGDYISGSYMR
jgi:CBS domain-containing protein